MSNRMMCMGAVAAALIAPRTWAWDGDKGRDQRSLSEAAAAPAGFEEASGRDTRHFPPHPLADFRHMRLDIVIPDMNTPHLSATETLSLRPIGEPLSTLPLDAKAMTIKSVAAEGRTGSRAEGQREVSPTGQPAVEPGGPRAARGPHQPARLPRDPAAHRARLADRAGAPVPARG